MSEEQSAWLLTGAFGGLIAIGALGPDPRVQAASYRLTQGFIVNNAVTYGAKLVARPEVRMPMRYPESVILESEIPRASSVLFQHLLDTYASETNKVVSVRTLTTSTEFSFRAA